MLSAPGVFFCGICTENRGKCGESITPGGRTEGRSCGRFRSFPVISGHFRSFFRSFLVMIPIDSAKSFRMIPFHSFSFHFITLSFLNPSFLCSTTYFLQIFQKFLQFPLAVPIILRTFANGYKMIVVYPAGRPFRLWLLSRRLFLCPRVSFC